MLRNALTFISLLNTLQLIIYHVCTIISYRLVAVNEYIIIAFTTIRTK